MLSENNWLALSHEGEKDSLQLAEQNPTSQPPFSLVLALSFAAMVRSTIHSLDLLLEYDNAHAYRETMRRVDCRR